MKISKLYKALEKEEKELENIEKREREVLKLCSSSIKLLHNNDLDKAEKLIKKAENLVLKTDWKFYTIAMQEFVEAYLFLNIKKNKKLISYPIKGVTPKAYVYGVLDLVGELKRAFLDSLINKRDKEALLYFNMMKEIYDSLSEIVIYNRVIPEFRRKLDIARIQLDQAHSILTSR